MNRKANARLLWLLEILAACKTYEFSDHSVQSVPDTAARPTQPSSAQHPYTSADKRVPGSDSSDRQGCNGKGCQRGAQYAERGTQKAARNTKKEDSHAGWGTKGAWPDGESSREGTEGSKGYVRSSEEGPWTGISMVTCIYFNDYIKTLSFGSPLFTFVPFPAEHEKGSTRTVNNKIFRIHIVQ